jgi:hypothetical protein
VRACYSYIYTYGLVIGGLLYYSPATAIYIYTYGLVIGGRL